VANQTNTEIGARLKFAQVRTSHVQRFHMRLRY